MPVSDGLVVVEVTARPLESVQVAVLLMQYWSLYVAVPPAGADQLRVLEVAATSENAGASVEVGRVSRLTSLEEALYSAIRRRAVQGDTVDELTAHAGYSARQLRRLMVRAFGIAPVQIIQTERLLFAKKLF